LRAARLRAIMATGIRGVVFMNDIGKILVLVGLVLAALGGLLWLGGKLPWFGRLPGDIHIDRERFKLYFPLTTCLLISILLTLLFRLIGKGD
jgi:hypothetical protein